MDTPSNGCDEVTSLLTCQHVTLCRSHHDRVEHALLRDTKVRLSISTRDSRTAPCYDMTARAHLRGITIGRRLIRLTQTNPSSSSTFIVMLSNDPINFISTRYSGLHLALTIHPILQLSLVAYQTSPFHPSHPDRHLMTPQRRISRIITKSLPHQYLPFTHLVKANPSTLNQPYYFLTL